MSSMGMQDFHRSPSSPAAGPSRGTSEWILVVDDELVVRDLLERFLTLEGYRVITAADGVEGVLRFREHSPIIRGAVLDLLMPRMDGHDAFYALRDINPSLPVLFMSGCTPGERTDALFGMAGTGFIHKPFVLGELLYKLQALVQGAPRPVATGAILDLPAVPRLEGITD